MNINPLNTDAARGAYVQNADAARGNAANRANEDDKRTDKAAKVDSVVLSDNAKSVAAARDAVKSSPDVRNEKVAEIKRSLTDGTYSVDARVLARKMLKDVE
jgi:negative regulator of flagellin synthesis FlgM